MNIVMVTERYLPIWGGAENQLSQLCPHILARGTKVTVLTRRWQKNLARKDFDGNTPVVRVGIPGNNRFATAVFILHLIAYIIWNRKHIDILHSHGAVKMGALCSVLSRYSNIKNITKIATAGHVKPLTESFIGRLLLKYFKYSDAIIAMTEEITNELLAIGVNKHQIVNITNGVNCNRFVCASSQDRQNWKMEREISPSTITVLFSGRLVKRKGLDILLSSWADISSINPCVHLFILGSGTTQPDSVEEEMKKLVVQEGIENVTFFGESKNPEHYLGNVDIFVFPSRIEGFPNALMEAMASGLAIVSSDIGGVKPLIKHKETGLLFESENREDLTRQIVRLLESSEKRSELGYKARKLMKKEYSFETISSDYMALYTRLTKTDI